MATSHRHNTRSPQRVAKPLILDELTIAREDTHTLRHVLSRWLRRLERAFQAVPVRLLQRDDRRIYITAVQAWRALFSRNRGLAAQILRLPTHAVLIECIMRHSHAKGDHRALTTWVRELSALVLLELATLRALPETSITVEITAASLPWLRSIRLNLLLPIPSQTTTLRFAPGYLYIADQTIEQTIEQTIDLRPSATLPSNAMRPYHEIIPGIYLALSDNNPLSDFEAHPDKTGNTLSLGDHTVAEWVDSLRRCFSLISCYLPNFTEELQLVARLIVPVGWDPERHLSASYQEYIGAVYMTLHPNDMTMVEAVVHEFQHNKINVAFNLDPLLHNAFTPLFSSPVRPDPRPLHGVILAVHAFQPVALLYERMRQTQHDQATNPAWLRRFKTIVDKIGEGAETVLQNADPTEAGQAYFTEMRRWHGHFTALSQLGFDSQGDHQGDQRS